MFIWVAAVIMMVAEVLLVIAVCSAACCAACSVVAVAFAVLSHAFAHAFAPVFAHMFASLSLVMQMGKTIVLALAAAALAYVAVRCLERIFFIFHYMCGCVSKRLLKAS